MIAQLYVLTEQEFAHILGTFTIVAQAAEDAAMGKFQRRA